jgi:predicted hotdog family 3-hydroxylacyl-ACP dehydratase
MPSIEDLIPHRPPMRLLDELVSHSDEATLCRVRITAGSTFVRHGQVPALVAVEYIAQCISVHATMQSIRAAGGAKVTPRIGYLIGVRQFELHRSHFLVGDELMVSAKHVWGNDQAAVFHGEVACGDAVAAEGDLTVAMPTDDGGPS